MTGIEVNELTYRNHINSFFCSAGSPPETAITARPKFRRTRASRLARHSFPWYCISHA